jgi:glycosyltransferase involved in cell wall biosynthesis
VLVIDNGSTDATAAVARQCWGDDAPAPMRVIKEPCIGLAYARERAFEEARYELISFIDDDNWVASDWVANASERMSAESELGAINSSNIAIADVNFPRWFRRWAHYYAAHGSCDSDYLEGWLLIGAGMTIRKLCWYDLKRNGFRPQLTDRIGARLTTCGDLELGCAIQLAGWRIRTEPRLRLQHYMTPGRLQWGYLRKLARSTGEAMALLDSYLFFSRVQGNFRDRVRSYWLLRLLSETLLLSRRFSTVKIVSSFFRDLEDDDDVIHLELALGRLIGLARLRGRYGSLHHEIARAAWRRTRLAI